MQPRVGFTLGLCLQRAFEFPSAEAEADVVIAGRIGLKPGHDSAPID